MLVDATRSPHVSWPWRVTPPGGTVLPPSGSAPSTLVAEAVNLDGVLQGGAGFRADSPTSRRRREAAFLPVQALTEVQLRASTTPSSAASPGRPTSGVGW